MERMKENEGHIMEGQRRSARRAAIRTDGIGRIRWPDLVCRAGGHKLVHVVRRSVG